MTLALIDGDIIAFRAAAGACQTFDFGDGDGKSTSSNPEQARECALDAVSSWQRLAKCRDVLVCFTGLTNFRKHILPTYKASRTKGKPPDYWTTVQAIHDRFPTRVVEGLEADDVLGILATTDRFIGNSIILTQDKDLRTVPGRHMNPIKETRPVEVSEADATYFWLLQTLMGDPTDGYVGIPGTGPAKARAVLGQSSVVSIPRLWPWVVAAYQKAKLTEADALTQARCARILHRSDYDKITKEILLWHPKTPQRLALADLVMPSAKALAA
jgi:5'-3' exonuclease